ncbi:MAG: phage tail family protein [Bacillus sp. (in: Bacteria)]|nr:phage tail family protein [Bacillus sp. (in: firmicutes)]
MSGMTFRGIRKDYVTILRGRKRPPWAPIKRNILTIPGMQGGYLESTDVLPRPEIVPIMIEANNMANLQKIKEDLAAWLITDQPQELIFDDEPDRTYFAIVDGLLDLDEMIRIGQGTVTFLCPDPYKYSTEKTANYANAVAIQLNGTVETYPTIKLDISQDTTFVAVSDGEKINMIGSPIRYEETIFEPETPILISSCTTLTGWTNSSSVSIEGADKLGVLKTNGNDFYTDDYGSMVGPWHGPAMKTSLGQVLQNFRFDVGFSMQSSPGNNQAGGIEVALLDVNNKIVAKVALTKHYGTLNNLYSRVRAGTTAIGHDVISEGQAIFKSAVGGIFRVSRKGNVWTAQIFYGEGGVFKSKILTTWTDNEAMAVTPVTQVQSRLLQRGDFPLVDQKIADINIYRLNAAGAGQVPIIARAGDIITFDHKTDIILKNGQPFLKEKAFIGEYFALSPGANAIVAEPSDSISNVEVRWRDRWL